VPGAEPVTGQVRGVYGLLREMAGRPSTGGKGVAGMANYRTGVRPGGVLMGAWMPGDGASTGAARETAGVAGRHSRGARGRGVGCA
jgi:hypothetical protein